MGKRTKTDHIMEELKKALSLFIIRSALEHPWSATMKFLNGYRNNRPINFDYS
jgi:hypothetical protein